MATDSTLRNMAFIFSILQEGFEKGAIEKEHTDIYAVIGKKEYFMEAKSVYKKEVRKKAGSSDLGEAMAQINYRGKEDGFGVIVTNQTFDDYQGNSLDNMKFNKLDKHDLDKFFDSNGFRTKINNYSCSEEMKKATRNKRLESYFILMIDGRNDEMLREKLASYLKDYLSKKGVDFNNKRIPTIIDISDKILNSLADKKDVQIELHSFIRWFTIRKKHHHEKIEYDDNAKRFFDSKKDMDNAMSRFNNTKNLLEMKKIHYDIILTSELEEFKEYLESLPCVDDEMKDNLRLSWLITNLERDS